MGQVPSHLALFVQWSWALPSGTQIISSIPEGGRKAHKYTCFARSALCTGNCDLCILKKLVFFTINRTGIFLNIARRIFLTKRGVIENARVGDVRGRGQASDYVGQHVPWWSYLQRFDFCICIYVFVFFG